MVVIAAMVAAKIKKTRAPLDELRPQYEIFDILFPFLDVHFPSRQKNPHAAAHAGDGAGDKPLNKAH